MTNKLSHRSLWLGRVVLGVGALLLFRLGIENISRPLEVAARTHTTLGSPDAITVVRTQGGVLIGIVIILCFCLVSERRLLAGLGVFTTIMTAVAGLRFLGLLLDGSGSFTLMTLKPEVIMAAIAAIATWMEWRRSKTPS